MEAREHQEKTCAEENKHRRNKKGNYTAYSYAEKKVLCINIFSSNLSLKYWLRTPFFHHKPAYTQKKDMRQKMQIFSKKLQIDNASTFHLTSRILSWYPVFKMVNHSSSCRFVQSNVGTFKH
jgi:hypothetical protein